MKYLTGFTLSVVLLCVGLVAYRAFLAPQSGPTFSQLPPSTQKQRRLEAQNLVKKVEAVAREARKPAASGAKKTFYLDASENQLNTLLQDRLRTGKFPVHDLSVSLSDGLLNLQGKADYGGAEWPATISGTLKAQDGALKYQIESLSVTGLPAPSNLRDKAQKTIENELQKYFANQKRIRIESVEITPGKLRLRGQVG